MDDYFFYFLGGSCGSFVKLIFSYYIWHKDPTYDPCPLLEIGSNGECHKLNPIQHTHYIDRIPEDKKIVVIDIDDDDYPSLTNMAVNKVITYEVSEAADYLVKNWGEKIGEKFSHIQIDNPDWDEITKVFKQNRSILFRDDWKQSLSQLNPVLIIKYKDIMFDDNLNATISKFLSVDPLPEVDKFIKEYRKINSCYLEYK